MKILSNLENFALDVLFPVTCLSCHEGSDWLCRKCFDKIDLLSSQACPYCEKATTPSGRFCVRCHEKYLKKNSLPPIDALLSATRYKEKNISHLIHLFKYNFIEDLHKPLGKLLVRSALKNNLPLPDIIIPVPLHPKRMRWRGFNQSELLARYLSRNLAPGLEFPLSPDMIRRAKHTTPQMKIRSYSDRKKNIQDSFKINRKADLETIKGKKILLIDDIATTGATLFECGQVLKKNGAQKVFAMVIARQEISQV